MAPKFSIFHFPNEISRRIIKELDPSDIIVLSLCSKRAHNLTKSRKSINCDLCICAGGPRPRIYAEIDRDGPPSDILEVQNALETPANAQEIVILGHRVPCVMNREYSNLVTFWEDTVLGIRTVAEYIFDFFNENHVATLIFEESSISMFDWINNRNMTLAETMFDNQEDLCQDEYSRILRSCRATEMMYLCARAPETFRFTEPLPNCTSLGFVPGSWITIDNLKSMNSSNIYIENSKMTSVDVNHFLRHWMNGGSDRLKYLLINSDIIDFDDDAIVRELDVQHVETRREYTWADQSTRVFNRSYEIQRADGVVASFFVCPDYRGHSELCMCVWPDFLGNTIA